jgi:phosphopantothenoylcysteine synthetase/decarboxylase
VRRTLITAGATRNPIDSMRFISAYATGSTGLRLAEDLSNSGSQVHLLGSPQACHAAPEGLSTEVFGSTHDLLSRVRRWVNQNPGSLVIHSAAVGDYEAEASEGKIKSGADELVLRLRPTPKILDQISQWDPTCFLVSFKAAAPRTDLSLLETIGRSQLLRSKSTIVFGNVIGALEAEVLLIREDSVEYFPSREEGLLALMQATRGAL